MLLLEAGGTDWHPLIHMPAGFAKMTKGIASWGWSTVPQKHMKDRVFWYTQAKVIGGGSSINAQIYTRGNARDYDAWDKEEGCAGWGYRDVLPYFKRAENNQRFANDYHGYGGPLGVSNPISRCRSARPIFRAGQEMGIPFNPDFNGASQEGVGYYQLTPEGCAALLRLGRLSEADPRAARTSPSGPASLVTRIVVEKGRAVGVEIVDKPGGQTTILRAEREVIVSSGAIGSPKLLMQSGIGPADHLKSVGVHADARPARRRLQPAGPSRPVRHRRMHRRPHLRQLRQAAPHGLGRPAISAVEEGPGGLQPVRDRRLLVRRPDRRARPTSSSISASAPASRPASRS